MHDKIITLPQTFAQLHPHHTNFWFWMAFGWTLLFCVGLILVHGRRIRIGAPYWWIAIATGALFPACVMLWGWWLFA